MSIEQVVARSRILVRRSPVEVFDAFTDPSVMSKFWFTRKDKGLFEGDTLSWFIGDASDAPRLEVRVKSIQRPSRIIVDWGEGERFTTVCWTFEEHSHGVTRLEIEERGFTGSSEEVFSQALDSTGGFNQVVVALKALLEHGVTINIVADHV